METTIITIAIVLFFVLLFFSKEEYNGIYLDDDYTPSDFKDNKKEEQFYHPTTGYKGTRSEMDAYIKNRERDLKNGNY